jgi:hypothetical protein
MSVTSNFASTQKIPQEAMQINKLTKNIAGNVEVSAFRESYHHVGCFCCNGIIL